MEKMMIMYMKEVLPYEPQKKRIESLQDLYDAIFTTKFVALMEFCLAEGFDLDTLLNCANKAISEKYPDEVAA